MYFYSLMTSLGFHLKYFNTRADFYGKCSFCSRIRLFIDFHAVGCIWTENSGRIWRLFREELDILDFGFVLIENREIKNSGLKGL